jgi:hypothetical protein
LARTSIKRRGEAREASFLNFVENITEVFSWATFPFRIGGTETNDHQTYAFALLDANHSGRYRIRAQNKVMLTSTGPVFMRSKP